MTEFDTIARFFCNICHFDYYEDQLQEHIHDGNLDSYEISSNF